MLGRSLALGATLLSVAVSPTLAAPPQQGTVAEEGTIRVPTMTVPPSTLISREARQRLARDAAKAKYVDPMDLVKAAPLVRQVYDGITGPAVTQARARYKVSVEEGRLGGVPVEIVTPATGVAPTKRSRVLINLHGGAFLVGGKWGGLLESIPVAALGGYKVVAVNYRMAPEASYPAASEDVAAVYTALLRDHRPQDIGIYGCSSGGTLTAQSVVWFARHKLPRPGAIGVLCASLSPDFAGDSVYTSAVLTGLPPVSPPTGDGRWPGSGSVPYMAKANLADAAASPLGHPEALRNFPPTLFITSTRAPELSSAVYSHQQLSKLGVDARLFVFEGLWHGFAGDVSIPEAEDFQQEVVRFFDQQLGK